MKDPQQRLRALSREQQSLLAMWLRAERGVTLRPPGGQATPLPPAPAEPDAERPATALPSADEVEGLSNEEVDSLLGEMLAAESGSPDRDVPDTNNMSDDEVAAMLAELLQLQQEESR